MTKSARDPFEQRMEAALTKARIWFERDDAESGLDFYLPGLNVFIEVKQFHSERIAEQMSRRPNVIAIQGEEALAFFEHAMLAASGSG